ncbi:hypothetical protein GA0070607_2308 [Micromonospora coriariae]|uniref:META domain-containing protein n=1 Tax=Micromonospora coriariae TaxID=285665 RepID=A0A1C4VLT5_9ACTN|nr:hypothetical protein [Micromonospora coriariae]SCE84771.1 hypothetical protein GA0070607_2308 [Micromonospora coriariae]
MSGRRYLIAVAAVGILLAGCSERVGLDTAAPGGSQAAASGPASAVSPQTDPVALIGTWKLAEVAEGAGDILQLTPDKHDGLLLFDSCGVMMGTWRANVDGLFVAGASGRSVSDNDSRKCRPGSEIMTPAWLRRASAFRVEGNSRVLLDDQGGHVARLLPGAKPTPRPNLLPSPSVPVVTDEVRRAFAPAAALPAALTPARRDALLGRWVPVDARPGRFRSGGPYVELLDDGTWRGSDGCNGDGGRWVAGPAGDFLATSGPTTAMGCANVLVGVWLSKAWRAGLDGEVLVLLDAQGGETGRLQRDS